MALTRTAFAHYLMIPLIVGGLLFLYIGWEFDSKYAIWTAPFLVGLAIVYFLQAEINWYRYTRKPEDLPPPLAALLERYSPYYRRLNHEDRLRFRQRVGLFSMGTDWMPKGFPEDRLPQDVELVIAAQAASLTWRRKDFLFEKFEKIIVFPGPFPSEQHPFGHASELYEPDGCLLFSAEQIMMAFAEPRRWFNVALYEYARAFMLNWPAEKLPEFAGQEALLERISRMSMSAIEAVIGINAPDLNAVGICHYIVFEERFREAAPELAAALDLVFKKDAA